MFNKKIRWPIGKWASNKAFAYYKSTSSNPSKRTYQGVPRYLVILLTWGFQGHSLLAGFRSKLGRVEIVKGGK